MTIKRHYLYAAIGSANNYCFTNISKYTNTSV